MARISSKGRVSSQERIGFGEWVERGYTSAAGQTMKGFQEGLYEKDSYSIHFLQVNLQLLGRLLDRLKHTAD